MQPRKHHQLIYDLVTRTVQQQRLTISAGSKKAGADSIHVRERAVDFIVAGEPFHDVINARNVVPARHADRRDWDFDHMQLLMRLHAPMDDRQTQDAVPTLSSKGRALLLQAAQKCRVPEQEQDVLDEVKLVSHIAKSAGCDQFLRVALPNLHQSRVSMPSVSTEDMIVMPCVSIGAYRQLRTRILYTSYHIYIYIPGPPFAERFLVSQFFGSPACIHEQGDSKHCPWHLDGFSNCVVNMRGFWCERHSNL